MAIAAQTHHANTERIQDLRQHADGCLDGAHVQARAGVILDPVAGGKRRNANTPHRRDGEGRGPGQVSLGGPVKILADSVVDLALSGAELDRCGRCRRSQARDHNRDEDAEPEEDTHKEQ